MATTDSTFDIRLWNERRSQDFLVNTVIFAIALVVGIIGNSMVIAVYVFKLRKKSDDRYFIPWLATFDLVASVVSITLFITLNSAPVFYTSAILCKALNYANRVLCMTSLLILLAIAIQRYKKICQVFGTRMSMKKKRLAVLLSVVVSVVTSGPVIVIYGVAEEENVAYNVTDSICKATNHPIELVIVYNSLVTVVSLGVIVAITVMYILIGRKIYRNLKSPSGLQNRIFTSPGNEAISLNNIAGSSTLDNTLTRMSHKSGLQKKAGASDQTTDNNIRQSVTAAISFRTNGPRSQSSISVYRYSYMFSTITGVTFVSYIVPWIIILVEMTNDRFWDNLTYTQHQVCLLLRRLYVLSFIINPFLFGLFDPAFRTELKNIFRKLIDNTE